MVHARSRAVIITIVVEGAEVALLHHRNIPRIILDLFAVGTVHVVLLGGWPRLFLDEDLFAWMRILRAIARLVLPRQVALKLLHDFFG